MIMENLREVSRLAKKLLNKKLYNKIKKLEDKTDKLETYKHAVVSSLDLEYHKLDLERINAGKKGKDVIIASLKLENLKHKLRILRLTYHKHDLEIIMNQISSIKKELENV
jgi:hypothetical protein